MSCASSSFALVDCNNFYVSAERVFQPDLVGRAVVVLSNNDGNVISRSEEAKALGIPMGLPFHALRPLRHSVRVLSSNYALYGDMSARVMSVLAQWAPAIEVYSIDEAFLDIGGIDDRTARCRHLVQTVRQWTGIPVSIGLAPTKVLAKLANRVAKRTRVPGGVFDLAPPDVRNDVLDRTGVEDLWGIAERLAARLAAHGIHTAAQLRDAEPAHLRQHFGVTVERIALELRGHTCLPLERAAKQRQQIMASRAFGQPLTQREDIAPPLAAHVARAAARLRSQGLRAAAIGVFLHTNPFRSDARQYHRTVTRAIEPSDDTGHLIAHAGELLAQAYRQGYHFHRVGCWLTDLRPRDRQAELLTPDAKDRMTVVDAINRRYGRGTITFAADLGAARGHPRSAWRSPCYTTRWSDLMTVR